MRTLRPILVPTETTSRLTPALPSPSRSPSSPASTEISSAPTLVASPARRVRRHRSICSNQTDTATTTTTMIEPSLWHIQLTESILSRVSTPSLDRQSNDGPISVGRRHSSPAIGAALSSKSIPSLPEPAITRARSSAAKVSPAPAISIQFDYRENDRSFSRWLERNHYGNLNQTITPKASASSLSTLGHFDTYVDQRFSRIQDEVKCIDKVSYHYQGTDTPDSMCTYGLGLFMMGFILPPAWWIGSFLPRKPQTDMEKKWRRMNRLMSFGFSLVVLTTILTIVIIWRFERT
ncbi:hypothetical protein K450DRAFT_281634 [Umbelopsis ramanniana AG]|uniref:Uncharacterized protein n=1 Tax=Umbelopsis ramanniana AG TaxID=1314678 RepID=A0AAD5HDH9_UMBRA|nr:uncharacterized protein K450DRAFT_281634 [Umbelopsis ramanniana AG]KAI8578581.1 hypothetical protein K450DRAFT_281634 [Umbelopsis ramanniana AG]